MLFRAVFFIGLVALLMPHAPHFVYRAATVRAPQIDGTSQSLAALRSGFFERLLQVRADIEAEQRARAAVRTAP